MSEKELPVSPTISVVSPVYQAEGIVAELVSRLKESLDEIGEPYEIILVEDGGEDNSWEKIKAECEIDDRVKGIRLSRNFGQQFAITAGLDAVSGEYTVVMDCDLQDDPRDISRLLEKARSGADIVFAVKRKRKHSSARNVLSKGFSSIFNLLAENQNADVREGSFSLLKRKVVEGFRSHGDAHRHYLIILRSMGFRRAYVEVDHHPRFEGKSSYSLKRLFGLAIDGVTSQSTKLLKFSIGVGFLYFLASLIGVFYLILKYFTDEQRTPAGWASTVVVLFGSTGLILMALGVLGVYIGNIYEQAKGRPLYIVSESVNSDHTKNEKR